MRGKLIILESVDGAGKGGCISALKNFYKGRRDDMVFTREPGGTPMAEVIRDVLLDPRSAAVTPLTEMLLFYTSRAQHVNELIGPALLAGKNVICERADPSTIAYQVYGRNREELLEVALQLSDLIWEKVMGLHSHEIFESKQIFDGVVYLDLPPEIGLARIAAEHRKNGIDRIEGEDLAFHTRVHEGYAWMIERKFFGPWYCIDANQPIETVQSEVISVVEKILQ